MNDFITTPLQFSLRRVDAGTAEPQWFFCKKTDFNPDPVMSLYYQNELHARLNGHLSEESALRYLIYFFTWCEEVGKPVSSILLSNMVFDPVDLNLFANWMRQRGTKVKPSNLDAGHKDHEEFYTQIDGNYYRQIIYAVAAFLKWAVTFLYQPEGYQRNSIELVEKKHTVKTMLEEWKTEKKNLVQRTEKTVDDLTDEEIIQIDKTLHPNFRTGSSRSTVVRDYLIWRIALEFGTRKGEILCLEVIDIPEGQQTYLEVRRTDERGPSYYDPRTNPPRVKTLSRVLEILLPSAPYQMDNTLKGGYEKSILSCSHVMHWSNEYLSLHRPFNAKHPFVFCEHTTGDFNPLSDTSVLSSYIQEATGILRFHLHLCRHSLFNRLFAVIIENNKEHDLYAIQYYGGWRNPKSMEVYTKRARKQLANKHLSQYQVMETAWRNVPTDPIDVEGQIIV